MRGFLRTVVLISVFLATLVPLIVTDSLIFPYLTGKTLFFRAIVEIMLAAWIALAWHEPQFRPRWSLLSYALVLFIVCAGIATLLGTDPTRSFWGTAERMEGYITLLHVFAYAVVAASVLKDARVWAAFWKVSLWVSVLTCFIAYAQNFNPDLRVSGTFGNPIFFAGYLLVHIFVGLIIVANSQQSKTDRLIYGAIVLVNGIFLFLTASRGALVGLLVGLFVTLLLIIFLERKRRYLVYFATGLLTLLLTVVGTFLVFKETPFIKESLVLERLGTISFETLKEQGRYHIWLAALEGFTERPVLGWGPENYRQVYNKFYPPEHTFDAMWFDRAHNTFLEWLVAGGIAGLVAYVGLFFSAFILTLKRTRDRLSAVSSSLVCGLLTAYLIHSFFAFDTVTSYVLIFSVLAYVHALSVAAPEPRKHARSQVRPHSTKDYFAYAAISVTLVFVMLEVNVRPFQAIQTAHASMSMLEQDAARSRLVFEGIDSTALKRQKDLTLHVSRHVLHQIEAGGLPEREREAWIATVEESLRERLAVDPEDPEALYYLGMFLREAGRLEESNTALEMALQQSPNRQAFMLEIAINKVALGSFDEAFTLAEDAFHLDESYGRARVIFAVVALYRNNARLAQELLREVETWETDDPLLVKAIIATGHTEFLIPIYERRAYLDPQNLQLLVALAAAHFDEGNSTRAIGLLEQAIQANPSFEQQGRDFIRQIRNGVRPQ